MLNTLKQINIVWSIILLSIIIYLSIEFIDQGIIALGGYLFLCSPMFLCIISLDLMLYKEE
jgi:hypothetical protein